MYYKKLSHYFDKKYDFCATKTNNFVKAINDYFNYNSTILKDPLRNCD